MALTCPGGGTPSFSKSSVSVSRSEMQAAMDAYLKANKGRVIKFPLRLYITNETAAVAGSAAKLVFDSAKPADVTDTDVINSGIGCTWYYIKEFDNSDFKKLNAGSSSGTSSSDTRGVKPMGSERSPFREPDIRLAMSRSTWTDVGLRAGWLKTAQAVDSAQIQKDMDASVKDQQAEAQKAQQAQQDLAELRVKEQELNKRMQDVQRRVAEAQRAGKGQDQSVMGPLSAEQYEIAQELQPIQEEMKKYEDLKNTLEAVSNPAMAQGLRLA